MKRKIYLLILCALSGLLIVRGGFARWPAGQTPAPPHVEVKIDPALFDRLVGQYASDKNPDAILSFWRERDRFFLQQIDHERIEIFSESETKYFAKTIDAQMAFEIAAQGKDAGVVVRLGGSEHRLRKISDEPVIEIPQTFAKREVMIPMRDGVRLHTVIFTPSGATEALPILLDRTPYGVAQTDSKQLNRRYKELVKDGYIFVRQDIRGRYASEGQFMMVRPPRGRKDSRSIDESTDAYDTIDWLVKNVEKNNGRVGMIGLSYGGWLAAVATINPHPALKASSPQAPMTDTYLGDDFFHNGAFRQTVGYEYVKSMESSREDTGDTLDKDTYAWYLGLGSLSKITQEFQGKLPTWNAFVAHPNYDAYWKARGAQRYLKQTPVATLVVGGWWDQEDAWGTLATYAALEKHDKKNQNFLVLGPWNHGGWYDSPGRTLADLNFGSATGRYFRSQIQAPWFAYYLKGRGKLNQPEATVFEGGVNRWATYRSWPPREVVVRELFLCGDRKLSFEHPNFNGPEFESYTSDSAAPVPYRKQPIEANNDPKGSGWGTWLVQDQRFLEGRHDVVSWQGEILDKDLTVSGDAVAHLFASTTGTDSDWVVKLIDVYPDNYPEDKKLAGYQLMVGDEIFRGRFRQSFETPAPLRPGEVNEYVIHLRSNDYCFRKGHRMMVQVHSTWFPLYDRNPQKFVENIFKAAPSDYQTATQCVYQSARYPSHVTLPVVR